MSLAGFDHVFAHAVPVQMSGGLSLRVAPPAVTALLKIVAYMEDPYRRAKDLQDMRVILARYEENGDRLFSDAVFDAQLPDFEFANAFLFGLDLREFATNEDAGYIGRFLDRFPARDREGRFEEDLDFGTKTFRGQIEAFREGFIGGQ
ncbi:MAG TPA: hypothetical protein VNY05_21515 [Candidatus Acidoferrales bacterium]|nr:hypothetical protein [Candidatus Acidoferrales bacterium]